MDPSQKVLFRHLAVTSIVVSVAACVHVGELTETGTRPAVTGPIHVEVERCVDRTDTPERDLGKEATQAFVEKLGATKEFVLQENARYRLACEVTGFVAGSAIKRWVLPGWGATVGQVSAMLTDSTSGEILMIAEGNATVSGGGLYTLGAESYIVPTAVEDVVERLCAWARGDPQEPGASSDDAATRRERR